MSIEKMGAVEEALAALEEARADAEQAQALVSQGSRDILADGPQMKVELLRRKQDIEAKAELVRQRVKDVERAVRAQIEEVQRVIGPLQKQVQMAEEGIWTLNLYLGREEEISVLTDGEPASIDEPIVIRQSVLSMDEESMAYYDVGGIDYKDIDVFNEWLVSDPEHLNQVLPERRGVIVLMPRRQGKHYSDDPWVDADKNQHNFKSHWIIRNGERVYCMTTNFNVGERLVPLSDEFTRFFDKDSFGSPIQPGTYAWEKAEEAADARQRHYMRVGMVLQGLIDRTTVLYPLKPGISVLAMESYDDGSVRVVTDAERAIGSGLEPFDQWHARMNRQMHPGMRIVFARNAAWRSAHTYSEYASDRYSRGTSRLSIDNASLPEPGIYRLEKASGAAGEFRFRYDRTDTRWGYEHGDWGNWGEWPYKRTGVYVTVYASDQFILPLEAVTAIEVERYINSRQDRHRYLDMLPMLNAALEAKRAEEVEEAPFRQLLVGEIHRTTGDDLSVIEESLPELIRDYKIGNKWHRPLVGMTIEEQTKAIRLIVKAYQRMAEGTTDHPIDAIIGKAPTTAAIWRYANGNYLSMEPQADAYKTQAERVFWTRRVWNSTGTEQLKVEEWKPLGTIRLQQVHATKTWDERDLNVNADHFITLPEQDSLMAQLRKKFPQAIAISRREPYSGEKRPRYVVWEADENELVWPDRVLTEQPPRYIVWKRIAEWSRADDGIRPALHRREEQALTEAVYPWIDRRHRFRNEPEKITDRSVWVDEERAPQIIERFEAEYAPMAKLRQMLDDQADRAYADLQEQWIKRAEEKRYAEFVAEYHDESLWEGHAKTLKPIEFPFKHYVTDHELPVPWKVIAVALEVGMTIDGWPFEKVLSSVARFLTAKDIANLTDDLDELIVHTAKPASVGSNTEDEDDDE